MRVYVICDQQDYGSIAPLEDHLFSQGFEVTLPLMEGDEAEVREDHKESLLLCDAVVIFYGNASEGWLRTKLRDLPENSRLWPHQAYAGAGDLHGPTRNAGQAALPHSRSAAAEKLR